MNGGPGFPSDGGVLLVDKPAGCTSHDVVGRVRWLLGTRRVGHAGTLDPMATGLLVVAIDRSTKLLGHLALTGKTYQATIRLGRASSTDDAEGELSEPADPAVVQQVTDPLIGAAIGLLTGQIQQVPSAVSAIKVDGRRAYERVRSGETVSLAARPVTVSRFETIGPVRRDAGLIDLDVEVDCSTGTYIRALARDLGENLGVGGHLTRLRRTAVGPFQVADAVDVYGPEGLPARRESRPEPLDRPERTQRTERPERTQRPVAPLEQLRAAIRPAAEIARAAFATREVDDETAIDVRYGRPIRADGLGGTYAVFHRGLLLALMRESGDLARPELVWAPA